MWDFSDLADEAFADLLKHGRPIDKVSRSRSARSVRRGLARSVSR
jgi:hypothetical protein